MHDYEYYECEIKSFTVYIKYTFPLIVIIHNTTELLHGKFPS
jgi:hypothetical protein